MYPAQFGDNGRIGAAMRSLGGKEDFKVNKLCRSGRRISRSRNFQEEKFKDASRIQLQSGGQCEDYTSNFAAEYHARTVKEIRSPFSTCSWQPVDWDKA